MKKNPGEIRQVKMIDLGPNRRRTGQSFNTAKDEIYRDFFEKK